MPIQIPALNTAEVCVVGFFRHVVQVGQDKLIVRNSQVMHVQEIDMTHERLAHLKMNPVLHGHDICLIDDNDFN